MAVGNTSFQLCDRFTWSFGWTGRARSRRPWTIWAARLAITSLTFMFVCVPLPVCQTDRGNSASWRPEGELDRRHAARIAAELGADLVKVTYTGSAATFRKVVEGCPIPVLIAGGEKAKSDRSILGNVRGALEAGAAPHLLPGGRPVEDAAARGEVAAAWNV